LNSYDKIIMCDTLIVGSGPGGVEVASVLCEAGYEVLMIEEGVDYGNIPCVNQADELKKKWRSNGLTVAFGKNPIAYAEGRCVGGGSEINSGIIQRPPIDLLNEWRIKYEINDFDDAALNDCYTYVFNKLNAVPPYSINDATQEKLVSGAIKMGWKYAKLELAGGGRDNRKMSYFLDNLKLKNNFKLLSEHYASRIVIGNSLAKYLVCEYVVDDKKYSRKIIFNNIFICCGAVGTAFLLLKSGMKKNIGSNLRMHPTIKLLSKFNEQFEEIKAKVSPFAVTEFMPNIRIGCSVRNNSIFKMAIAEDWEQRKDLSNNYSYCQMHYVMIRASARGKIYSIPGAKFPILKYELEKSDWEKLSDGVKYVSRLLFASGATEIYPSISGQSSWKDIGDMESHCQLKNLHSNARLYSIHLFSSCPMGENKKICAVDSYGKLHGFDNIYVADASVIPEAPGVNPQATVMAMANRFARNYLINK
jgi:choline dehydrogenase-like flavoprotein